MIVQCRIPSRMPQDQPESSPTRRYLVLALKLSVSVILLVVLFSRIDVAQLWQTAKEASVPWLLVAITIFALSTVVAAWRWNLLLKAQHIEIGLRSLLGSFLVATYFNNFLPSNIGGDFIRISDTARHTNSKTLATTVVLMDRILGLIALAFVAALGATAIGRLHHAAAPIWPVWLWAGFLAGAAATTPGRLRACRLRRAPPPAHSLSPRMGRQPHHHTDGSAGEVRQRNPARCSRRSRARSWCKAPSCCSTSPWRTRCTSTSRFSDLAVVDADVVRRPTDAGIGGRLRRARGVLLVLLPPHRSADRGRRPAVAGRRRRC